MKNFTKQNFKTNPLWIRLLIMTFMLLLGSSSAWAVDYYLRGTFNNWLDGGMQDAYKFAGGSGTVKVNLTAGTYSFKIATNNWSEAYSVSNSTMKRDNCSNWQLYTNNGDLNIEADVTGEYSFNFNSSKKLTITYPPQCTKCCTDYYVAGDAGLCGEDWNVNADKMTCSNNVWTKTFTNINNGTYYFQITNGTWDVKKGEYDNSKGNITLSNVDDGYGAKKIKLTTTSKGNITISFDGTKAWVDFEQPCYSSSDVEPGTISSNATNNAICGSGSVKLTLSNTTTKDGLTKSIQWQKYSGSSWSDINGATSTSYTTETISTTTKYRAKVTWEKTNCTAITEYASEDGFTVTVNAIPTAPFDGIAQNVTICAGNYKFSSDYIWYTSTDGNGTVSGSTNLSETTTYYISKKVNNCESARTAYTVNVDPKPDLELTSSSVTICQGTEITLSDYVNNNTIGTVKWYSDENRSNEIANLTFTPSVGENKYYARATNGVCTTNSDKTLTVTVVSAPKKPTLNTNDNVLATDESATLTIGNTESGVTYTLYKDGNPTSNTVSTSPYTFTNITEGGVYKVKGTNNNPNGCKETEFSDEVTIEICATVPTPELSIEQGITDNCGEITNGIIEISNYASFEGCTFTLNDNTVTPTNEGKIEVTASGTCRVVVTNSCGNRNTEEIEMTKTTIRAPRTDFEVSLSYPQVAFAQNNGSVYIDLSGSERNVTYYLYKNDVKVDGSETLSLEGKALRWTVSESGTYTVKADNPCNGEIAMTGQVDFTCMSNLNIAFEGGKTVFCPNETANIIVTFNGTGKGNNITNPGKYGWQWSTNNITYTSVYLTESGVKVPVTIKGDGSISLNVRSCDDTVNSNELTFTVVPAPTAPTVAVLQNIEKCGSDITKYGKIQITNYNSDYRYKIGVNNDPLDPSAIDENGNISGLTIADQFTLYAINGCEVETPSAAFTITETDNKPTVEISGKTSAVFYEDVVLTATATTGATVKWYEGGEEKATGATYDVTSASDASKTVTAKAFLNGCESAVASHTVNFTEEDCAEIPCNDIEIKFTHPSSKSTDNAKKGQWWGMGTLYYSTDNSTWKEIDMGSATSGSVTKTISNISKSQLYVYFQSYWTYSHETKAKTNTLTLDRGNKYSVTITRHGDNNTNATATATKTGSLTQSKPITAPAVKMVSAEYDEVNDKIVATGAVYKTGCGETFWGFQYSADGQTWGTTDADFIRPSSGNSLSEPGVFAHSFEIPNANGGDIYYIKAYAINNYNKDNYSLNSAVLSETKIPVEIPSSTIESATISLVDSEGNPSTNSEVCPQSTVYLKVSYVGGDYKEFEATENFPGTNLVEVTRNKLDNYAIFSFTATSAGTANITISNNNSSVTPATGVAITLYDVETIAAPYISIDPASGVICDGDEATITVTNPTTECSYKLVRDGSKAGFTPYESGDLTYSVNSVDKYYVVAQHNACTSNEYTSNQVAITQVISTSAKISIEPENQETTPWEPVSITITADEGYIYEVTYTTNNLADVDGVIIKQNGDTYTYRIPRPWTGASGEGNSATTRTPVTYGIKAQLKVDGESNQCDLSSDTATIKVKDEDNEDCD